MGRVERIQRPQAWREAFIRAHDFRCHYCNRSGGTEYGPGRRPWHVDHKEPLADGGQDVEDNLALACKRCNIAKGARPYRWFRRFSRVAFWEEATHEPPSEDQLEELLDAYFATPDGTWSVQRPEPETPNSPYRVLSRPDEELSDRCDEEVAVIPRAHGRDPADFPTACFLVLAHRLVPELVAEVRLLRAELAQPEEPTESTTRAA